MNKNKQDGYDAYAEGIPYTDNPFGSESMAHEEWGIGWSIAKEDHREYMDSNSPFSEEDDYAEE